MNNKILNIAFAAVLFLCAYYVFDWYDWTQLGVSTVLVSERRQLASARFGIAGTPKFCACLSSNGSRYSRISDHQNTHIRLSPPAGPQASHLHGRCL